MVEQKEVTIPSTQIGYIEVVTDEPNLRHEPVFNGAGKGEGEKMEALYTCTMCLVCMNNCFACVENFQDCCCCCSQD